MKNFIAAAAILAFCAGSAVAQNAPDPTSTNSQNNGQATVHPTRTKTDTRCSTERAVGSKGCKVSANVAMIKHAKHKRKHMMRPGVENNTEINKTP